MSTLEQTPGALDITIVQGDDLSLQLTQASNFSGYSFIGTVHHLHGSAVTATTSFISSASSSTVQITFPSTLTGSLAVTTNEGAHNWKILYTDTSGLTRTWIKGAFTVLTKI